MPNYRYYPQDSMRRGSCGCGQTQPQAPCSGKAGTDPLQGMPVAMAYVPWQEWGGLYDPRQGFCCGTIFEDLNKPFQGTGGCRR